MGGTYPLVTPLGECGRFLSLPFFCPYTVCVVKNVGIAEETK